MKGALKGIFLLLTLGVFTTGCFLWRTETVVTLNEVPPAVRTSIEKVTAGSKIKQIEKIDRRGDVVYEVEYIRDGKELDAYIAPDGKIVKGG